MGRTTDSRSVGSADALSMRNGPSSPTIDLTTFRVLHRALVRDARLLATVSAAWAERPSLTAEQLRSVANYLDQYLALLHHHHDGEDRLIWAAVAESGERDAARLGALTEDHRALDPLLVRIPQTLRQLAARPDDHSLAEGLARDTALLANLLERHIDVEERDLFPAITTLVTPARWRRVEGRLRRGLHPRRVGFFAAWLASAATEAEAERLPLRPIARLNRGRYTRRVTAAFGPQTPPGADRHDVGRTS
jgi:hemerythrin-like domain-containing protein